MASLIRSMTSLFGFSSNEEPRPTVQEEKLKEPLIEVPPETEQTHIVIVLDESGSMMATESEVLKTLNSFISKQSEEKTNDDCTLTIVKFNDYVQVLVDKKKIKDVPHLTKRDYDPHNGTALFDAMGTAIEKFRDVKRVVFVVLTDGLENSSHKYNKSEIKQMLDSRVNPDTYAWNVIYLSADPMLVEQGEQMGVSSGVEGMARGCSNMPVDFRTLSSNVQSISRGISDYRKKKSAVVKISLPDELKTSVGYSGSTCSSGSSGPNSVSTSVYSSPSGGSGPSDNLGFNVSSSTVNMTKKSSGLNRVTYSS